MTSKILIVLAAAAALAACDRPADKNAARDAQKSAPSSSAPSSAAGASQTPSTPANLPAPASQEEKREGANPQQGQVDPKESTQRKDFQQKGDSAGPTSPETTPRK